MARPTDWWVLDLSGAPVPGDPSTISDVARKWSSVADDADTARTQISSLLGDQAVMQWLGKAGDAFRSHSSKLPGQLQKCSDSYHQAASALTTWSTQLEAHQGVADHALVLGRAALTDLHNAQNQLSSAQLNENSANGTVNGLNATTRQAAHDSTVPPPDPARVRAAVNRAAAASQAVASAQHAVGDAQARLDAAKRMAADAAAARDGDGHTTATRLHSAADAGIPPDSFWHKLGDALGKAWHVLVEIAKVVVVIAAVIAIVVGGPIAWVVFAAAVIILADTIAQYAQGKASLLDVGMAALGCIPGEGMLEDLSIVSSLADDTTAVRTATQDTTTVVRDTTDTAAMTDDSSAAMHTFSESGATVRHSPTSTAIGDDGNTLQNFARSRGVDGHDVIVHGDADGNFRVNGLATHPNQIADMIKANPDYDGGPVNLVTCFGGRSAAAELEQILGVPVRASDFEVDLDPITGELREWP